MTITQIKILGLFDNDDLVLRIMNIIDDEINTEFNVEVIPKGGVTFFRIIVNGEFAMYTVRNLINSINSLIGNGPYDAVQAILTAGEYEIKVDVDGNHDININMN
jgi:hypothetical protein